MFYFILLLLTISQIYTLAKIISYSKSKKESESVIEKYKGVTTLAKIPEKIYYKDVEPDWQTFYNFMENIKLEDWKTEIEEYLSSWSVNLISHDGNSSMRATLRDYGDGLFLASCNIRAGGAGLSVSKEDEIASDIILFIWDYVVKYNEDENNKVIASYKDTVNRINSQLKTLNRSKRLNNILEL